MRVQRCCVNHEIHKPHEKQNPQDHSGSYSEASAAKWEHCRLSFYSTYQRVSFRVVCAFRGCPQMCQADFFLTIVPSAILAFTSLYL